MYPRFTFGGFARFARVFISFVALFAGAASSSAQPGLTTYGNVFRTSTGFSTMIESSSNQVFFHAVVATSDGGFLVGGDFTAIGGQPHLGLAKYKADGTVDVAFNTNGGFDGRVDCIAVQADGRILVAGAFSSFNGTACAGFARLNANGTLDSTFVPGSAFARPGKILVQADGRILVTRRVESAFSAAVVNGAPSESRVVALAAPVDLSRGIARLNADGSVDSTFDPGTGPDSFITCLMVQADGRILLGGAFTINNGASYFYLQRLLANGSLDTSFNAGAALNGFVRSVAVKANGKIVVCGSFSAVNGTTANIAGLNTDGSVDSTFTPAACAFLPEALAVQTDGKIVLGGYFNNFVGTAPANTARLNADGSLDATYAPVSLGYFNVLAVALQADGRVLVGGYNVFQGATVPASIARLTTTGALDPLATGIPRGLADWTVVKSFEGKFIVAGNFNWVNGVARNGIARLNSNGSLDSTFNNFGTGLDGKGLCLAMQPDRKIIVGGSFTSFDGYVRQGIVRLNADGTADGTFIPAVALDGYVQSVAVQADGRILAAGGTLNRQIVRFNANGSLDTTFVPDANLVPQTINSVVVQADGRILIGGDLSIYSSGVKVGQNIARLNANGTTDLSYNVMVNTTVQSLVLLSDGKALVSGSFSSINGTTIYSLARLNTNGTLDSAFSPGSIIQYAIGIAPVVQSDGRLIVCKSVPFPYTIVRLEADGRSPDNNFKVHDFNGYPTSVCYTDSGDLVVAGGMAFSGAVKQVGLVVLRSDPMPIVPRPLTAKDIRGSAPSLWFVLVIIPLLVSGRKRFCR